MRCDSATADTLIGVYNWETSPKKCGIGWLLVRGKNSANSWHIRKVGAKSKVSRILYGDVYKGIYAR